MEAYASTARRPRPAEIEADFAVHLIGMLSGAMGAAALVILAAASGASTVFWSVLVYSVALIAMLGFSAAYHLRRASARRELLRRLDHGAIFVMIAGTYTPFTVCVLDGGLAIWSTVSIWLAAVTGAAIKFVYPRRLERASIPIYLALGWAVLVIARPLFAAVDRPTATLIVVGGVVYSIGTAIHCWRRLPFHDSIWHGLVLVAASCHYAAIVQGIVLAGSPS
jgi:hemolysin III